MNSVFAALYVAFVALSTAQPDGSFTHVDTSTTYDDGTVDNCHCTVYEVYCQQSVCDAPYQQSAAKFCESRSIQPGGPSGRLAVLDSEEIDQTVRQFIINEGLNSTECIPKFGFWIGLSDAATEDEHVWSDGDSICASGFSNWAPGEPNNNDKKDPDGQDSVQLWFRYDHAGSWDDEYSNYRPKGIVCEVPDPYCHSLDA